LNILKIYQKNAEIFSVIIEKNNTDWICTTNKNYIVKQNENEKYDTCKLVCGIIKQND